ncbi:MAG TPA: hypothetical protein VFN22_11810 [Gemmatimonadales bacterium]|nr:hypothetical protein [Gemmatimonadales bacterium]
MMLLLLALVVPQDTLHFDFTVQTVRSVMPVGTGRPPVFDSLSVVGHLTVVLSDTVGGRVAHARIDSAGSSRQTVARVPQFGGNRYSVLLPQGRAPAPITTDETSLSAMHGLPVVAALFPAIRPRAAINDRWVDTTEVEHVVAGVRSRGTRITSWFVVDRRDDALLVSGTFAGSAAATLDPSNTITLAQRGSLRAVVRPGWPADVAEVTDSADVELMLSGTGLHVRQLTTVTLVRRNFRPSGRPTLRRRVPN